MLARLLGIAGLLTLTTVAIAADAAVPAIVPVRGFSTQEPVLAMPRELPDGTGPALATPPSVLPPDGSIATALPDPTYKFLPDSCGCGGCNCCKRPRNWVSLEYLLWGLRDDRLDPPVFVQDPRFAERAPGPLGTTTVFGDQDLGMGAFNGVRVNFGHWFNPACTIGIELSGFVLAQNSETFRIDATPNDPFSTLR